VEAADLDAANKIQLDAAYRDGRQETAGAEHIVVVLGLALAGGLLVLQGYLFRRTRRVFSLPLVAATLVAVVLTVFLATRFVAARESLRIAKEDAFDSIHSLVKARTLAYDANGDESRFLLDAAQAKGFEVAFNDKVAKLTTSPTAKAPSDSELAQRKQKGRKKGDTGLFWDELDNVTFPGELKAATQMVQSFRDYMLIDGRVRKLAASGKMADAIDLAIGDKPEQSNGVFARFDAALQATLDINRTWFDQEIDQTSRSLRTAEVVLVFLSVAVVALTWLGIRPRLREYTS